MLRLIGVLLAHSDVDTVTPHTQDAAALATAIGDSMMRLVHGVSSWPIEDECKRIALGYKYLPVAASLRVALNATGVHELDRLLSCSMPYKSIRIPSAPPPLIHPYVVHMHRELLHTIHTIQAADPQGAARMYMTGDEMDIICRYWLGDLCDGGK